MIGGIERIFDRRLAAAVAWFVVSSLLVAPALAQDEPAAQKPPTEEQLDGWLKAVDAAEDLTDEQKAARKETYENAKSFLQQSAEAQQTKEQMDAARLRAPESLAEAEKALADDTPPPPPVVPPDATLARIEQLAAEADAKHLASSNDADGLKDEVTRRETRRGELRDLQEISANALAVRQEQVSAADPGAAAAPLEDAFAQHELALAEIDYRTHEQAAYESELLRYDAEKSLLPKQQEVAAKRLKALETTSAAWDEIVAKVREREAALEEKKARSALRQAAGDPEVVRDALGENLTIAARLSELGRIIDSAKDRATDAESRHDEVESSLEGVRERVKKYGIGKEVASYLHERWTRTRRGGAEAVDALDDVVGADQNQLLMLDLERLNRRDERDALDPEIAADARLDRVDAAGDRTALRARLVEILAERRRLLLELTTRLAASIRALDGVINTNRATVTLEAERRSYLSGVLLWTRELPAVDRDVLAKAGSGLAWLGAPSRWRSAASALGGDAVAHPLVWTATPLLLLLLAIGAYRARQRLALRGVSKTPALVATWDGALHGTLVYVVFRFLASRLDGSAGDDSFLVAVARGLESTATVASILAFLARVVLTLSEHLTSAAPGLLRRVGHGLRIVALTSLPTVFSIAAFRSLPDPTWYESAGRLGYLVFMVALACVALVLAPTIRALLVRSSRTAGGSQLAWRLSYSLFAIALPLLSSGLAVYGYFFTCTFFSRHLLITAWFLALLRLAVTFARELLGVAYERRLRASEMMDEEERERRIIRLNEEADQARELLRLTSAIVIVLMVWWIWADSVPALDFLTVKTLWGAGDAAVNAVDVLSAVLTLVVTIIATKNVPGMLQLTVLRPLPLDAGARYAALTITRYLLATFGTVLAIGHLGVRWENIQWLVAAVGVGLGFGLQEIVANFVSGLILLLERPVRVGDIITVGTISGRVTRIQARATTVLDWDRKELVIPNRELIVQQVVNWTLSDSVLRLVVSVQVRQGADPELVKKLLLEAAEATPRILSDPPPTVVIQRVQEGAMDFDLLVFLPELGAKFPAQTELNARIDKLLRENDVPFFHPIQELHVQGGAVDTTEK